MKGLPGFRRGRPIVAMSLAAGLFLAVAARPAPAGETPAAPAAPAAKPSEFYAAMPDQFISMTLDAALKGVDNKKQPGVWLPSRRPITRHTYGSICFLEDQGLMLAGGGSTYSGPNRYKVDFWCDVGNPGGVWLNGPADIWLYNFAKNEWTYKGSGKAEGAKPGFPRGSGTATYAPDLKSAIVVSDATWLYDADKDVWTRKSAKCPGGGHSVMTYDTKRKLAYHVGRSGKELKMHSYDPARDVWAEVRAGGELPSNRDGGQRVDLQPLPVRRGQQRGLPGHRHPRLARRRVGLPLQEAGGGRRRGEVGRSRGEWR